MQADCINIKGMEITKNRFLGMVATMLVIAGILAWQIPDASGSDMGTADVVYLVMTLMAVALCIRVEAFTAAQAIVYGSSLLFCFFYLFIAPFEAPVMMVLFFMPALLWQKRKISGLHLALIGAALVWLSWKILGRPAILILLMPTCQILAIRVSNSVQTRYSRDGSIVNVQLSSTQKQQMRKAGAEESKDWWEIIRPEIEAFPERIKEIWQDYTNDSPRRHQGSESVLDIRLLQMQNARVMSLALTTIKKRDEQFASDAFLKRVEKLFWKIQNAWYDQELETIQALVSDALYEQLKCQVDSQKAMGIKYRHSKMIVYEMRMAQVNCDNSFDVIHVFIRASSADSAIDTKTGETLAANEESRKFSEYWTLIRRPSAKTLQKPGLIEGSCPNCGAPIQIGQATVCGVCNSFIRSGFYDWVLAKITQACEWEYKEPGLIPDWNTIKSTDPDFTLQQIEDRAGVIFWMMRLAEHSKSVEPLQRFSTEAFCELYQATDRERGYNYMENVALASVSLKGFKITKHWNSLFLLVIWSGVPTMLDKAGRVLEGQRTNQIMREIYILGRRNGVKTNQNNTLSSAHCPGCGGPLGSAFVVSCVYCNAILNEGSNSWILERIAGENDSAYLNTLSRKTTSENELEEDGATRSARDVITIMAQILLADEKTDPEEMKLLEKIAQCYDMSEEQLNMIISSLKSGEVYIPAPADTRESWNLMLAAARMALADNEITPAEERELILLAQHIGYSAADVTRVIKAEEKRRFAEQREVQQKAAFAKLYPNKPKFEAMPEDEDDQ
ncbi:MAG: TIM44-like domain-containing protein [Candidatus Riflebacteria bacterium]|nr:TIM44-like domain-containing protein [Candidatus Riflebacteria bacterium]